MDDDLLFDYMFLENQDKEEENQRLKEENDDLKEQLNNRKTSVADDEDYDKPRFFAEDVQSIAADCWVKMEISYEEAEKAIKQWYTPEEYYEYKIGNQSF